MRLFKYQPTVARPSMAVDPYRSIVEQHFRIYEAREERMPGGVARMYFLMFPAAELESRFDGARKALLASDPDLIVFLRREGGEDILVVAPRAPVLEKGNRVNWILLAATLVTTIMSGAIYWQGYKHADEAWSWAVLLSPEHLFWGFLTLALPLMLILGIHETAHYMAARKHGLRASLPFFIPFPPFFMPIGTLGAFIRLKDPLPDRKALFDVGASGPIAGLIIAVPVLLLGIYLTDAEAIVIPDADRPLLDLDTEYELEEDETGLTRLAITNATAGTYLLRIEAPPGDSWSYTVTADVVADTSTSETFSGKLAGGNATLRTVTLPENTTAATLRVEWDDGLVRFGDPLLVQGLQKIGIGNSEYLTHPVYFAGWIGLFVTGLNLIPASQLDGGHIARAVLGDNMRFAAYGAVGLLFYLAFQFQTWLLLAILILFMGVAHPPPLNDRVKLDAKRKVAAALTLVVLVVTFIPIPFVF